MAVPKRPSKGHPLKTPLTVLAAALLASASMTALAIDEAQAARMRSQIEKRFADADVNHDGKLTREEAAARMPRVAQAFDQIDAGKLGYVTKDQVIEKMIELAGQ
jgi:hypothetical protein